MIVEKIKQSIMEALKSLGLSIPDIYLEHPADILHGDYASNVALVLAKSQGGNPRELAEKVVRYIVQQQLEEVEKVDVAGAGFINFFLSRDFFAGNVRKILESGEEWGKNKMLLGKKVMVEYTDPNPFKEFHIGHLMSNAIGESIARLIEFSGAEVKRASYQGDVGLHVAKALWGKMKKPNVKWGEAYGWGAAKYEEEEEAKKEIREINKEIYESLYGKGSKKKDLLELYSEGKAESFREFEKIYKKLGTFNEKTGTGFDYYYFESYSGVYGKRIVEEHPEVFEQSEGAIVFRGGKEGLHTRVFLNSEGLPTYEAKEIGLAFLKEERHPADIFVSITGNEIVEYFKVVLAALRRINAKLAEKIVHIPHGMLRLPSGKMSSRTGDIVTAESLIDEVSKRVKEKMSERATGKEQETIEAIAIGAIKYSILKQGMGSDIVFDFEKSVSFEGDSGPYLQYAATRAHSILGRAGSADNVERVPKEVIEIERLLYRFPEIVERAAREYEPHYVATFLTELAGTFNSWYAKEKIIDDTPESPYKLALTKAFHQTMMNGLFLLGIKTPERM
ncbi:arginine--tRNA ligase [Candidatus Kaiserbacteria bacterium RIFCSPHIGHO2_02_FULL_50_9]|uniref:Arginine--tRNA ligase n=1 Tax=Candidatus Kaiserbacteria bacterium RIFCSPLOWO2_01_FULL_51_21 TaxID=1798508 RepID=A0A1F6ED66_9BACT|nr:MAG: arginine--tRNA ligase [Candidatus Kaiserbacteria bacterium RIFCSPHIGHO2_01_FULL_51_33]OGG63776.1 MAG: arginine--tRNA ligase [Candidatus Kaiserbacteria bacterium RIFCSPHIGHO2_02_FULL_50_9]OGG71608.1 MAG: arginine--tRNA ligase [Candidatus Kaiserbacteria bacterium RIFCSPLOWO2_01_FULL_51_21]